MGNFIKTQSSFANGEIAPDFYTNDNLNGLSKLLNMDVTAGGGLTRRGGLVSVAALDAATRLVPFSVGESDEYMLTLSDGHIHIYSNGTHIQDISAPWTSGDIDKLQYAQRFGTMIFVHPDYQPRILTRVANGFELTLFEFERSDVDMSVHIPFIRFDDTSDIKITVSANSAGNNYATFTTSRAFWTTDDLHGRFLLLGHQWTITSIDSATVATAQTNGAYTLPSAPVSDWYESAFSVRRGWPVSITFHQNRLVFGGSRSYPAGVWMSTVGRHRNFDVGTGLDDQAIFITLLSAQRQQICTVVGADNLQILTTVGEWAIANKPLTPASVDIKQHTSVGSIASRFLAPQSVEGATVFVAAGGRDIRELCLDDLGENYNATDLCAFAKHLMSSPVDIAYNATSRQLFVVMASGDMAVLNHNSALEISAWGTYQTNGQFKSVAVCGGETFVVVYRGGNFCLEKFSHDAYSDVTNIPFRVAAAGVPLRASGHNAAVLRVRKITARVMDTKTLFINGVRANLPNAVYDENASGFTGDVSVGALGWTRETFGAPWRIESDDALPITVMSVTIYGNYTV